MAIISSWFIFVGLSKLFGYSIDGFVSHNFPQRLNSIKTFDCSCVSSASWLLRSSFNRIRSSFLVSSGAWASSDSIKINKWTTGSHVALPGVGVASKLGASSTGGEGLLILWTSCKLGVWDSSSSSTIFAWKEYASEEVWVLSRGAGVGVFSLSESAAGVTSREGVRDFSEALKVVIIYHLINAIFSKKEFKPD